MSPSSHIPKYDEAAPQLPDLSRDFKMELGFGAGGLHEQLEERQQPVQSYSSGSPIKENAYSRVKSVHGVIEHHSAIPIHQTGDASNASGMGVISEHEEDIGTQREAMNSLDWIEEKRKSITPVSSPVQEQKFAPRGSSLRAESTSPVLHVTPPQSPQAVRPPPRSSSYHGSQPNSPQPQQERQLLGYERVSLVDSGPVSESGSTMRRIASDSAVAQRQNQTSTLTPRQRRQQGAVTPPPSASKYATFEEMGIRGRGIAEVQAEKEDRECIIM